MKTLRAIFAAVVACSGGLALQAQVVNGIKAVVHDSVITFREVDISTAFVAGTLANQYPNDRETYQKKLAEALNENLDQLVERQLILRDFASAGYSLPESIIDEIVQERIRARFGDRASLTKSLKAEGITYEKFRQQVRDQFIIEALRGKNINSEILISPHKIETYYKEHPDKYRLEDQVKLRMIVLNKPSQGDVAPTRQIADEILGRLKQGSSFAEMASVYSQGSQRNQGGDWGWVERSVLRKELADAAFSIKPGEPSGVIETPESFYIMLVEEARTAHQKPLNEVRDEIEKIMIGQEQARLEKQWIGRLKKKTFVRFF